MPRDKKPRTNQPTKIRSIKEILKAAQINGKSIFDPENKAFLDENKDNPSIAFLVKTNKLIREYELNSVLRLMLEGYIKEKSLMPVLDYNKIIEVGTPEGRKAYFLMNTDKSTLIERALEVALIDIEPLLGAATTPTPNDAPGIREKILNFFSNLFKREHQQNLPQNVNPTPGLWQRIKAFFSSVFFKEQTQDRSSQQASSPVTPSSFDNAAFDPNKTLVGAQQFNAAADQLKAKKDLDVIESFALQALSEKAQTKDKPSTSENSKKENFLDILSNYLEEPKPEGESLIEAEPLVEDESSNEDVLEEDDIFKAIENSDLEKMVALLSEGNINLKEQNNKGFSILQVLIDKAIYESQPDSLKEFLIYVQSLPEDIQADIYNSGKMKVGRTTEIAPFDYYQKRVKEEDKDQSLVTSLAKLDDISKKEDEEETLLDKQTNTNTLTTNTPKKPASFYNEQDKRFRLPQMPKLRTKPKKAVTFSETVQTKQIPTIDSSELDTGVQLGEAEQSDNQKKPK